MFQDSLILLWHSFGQAFKEDVWCSQITAKDLVPDAGAELVRKVYALGKQGCSPDGTGADVVFPCNALTGFLGGLPVFILNTTGWCRERVLVPVESIMLFCVVLLPNEELFLFWGQIASPGSLKSKDKR